MSTGILDILPSDIRDQAVASGFENTAIQTEWQTWSHFPSELLEAYRDAYYENIKSHGNKAFVKVKNAAGQEFQIAISGPAKKPTGCMFIWDSKSLKQNSASAAAEPQDDVPNNDFYIGTISYQSKILGISKGVWDSKVASIATGVISAVAALVAGWIAKRLVGLGIKLPAQLAAEEVAGMLVADGALEAGAAATFATFATGVLVGSAIGIAVFLLSIILLDYLKKNYQVAVTIQNYDTESEYEISDCHTDNGYLDDHSPFKAQTLTRPTGGVVNVEDSRYIPNGTFIFDNDSTWMQGLGVALTIKRKADSNAFQLKYLCSWWKDNLLGLTDGASESPKDYYNDDSTWSAAGSKKAAITLGKTGIPVTATTNALAKEQKGVYTYIIVIGNPPTKAQDAKPASLEATTLSAEPATLAFEGDGAHVPGLGDTINLPGGPAKVIGRW
ncbi:hypothetical protein SI65_07422 [Aspergillus cristatus]|uniref:Uncharacterized protein n=1 Tax=Aspergillus cristatus TaxID=573508 RepID=A0A1E3B7S6_ASPCR|nr:hypothetical protein SI65_07422 [Aspergillus cristatus]